jgi:hypothetical protein
MQFLIGASYFSLLQNTQSSVCTVQLNSTEFSATSEWSLMVSVQKEHHRQFKEFILESKAASFVTTEFILSVGLRLWSSGMYD